MLGENVLELAEETTVCSRAVVASKRMDFLVDGQRSPAEGQCGGEHQPLMPGFAVGPVDDNDGALDTSEQPMRERPVDSDPLGMQVGIDEQPVDAFDLDLGASRTREPTPDVRQSQSAAAKQSLYGIGQAHRPGAVNEWGIAFEPSFQESDGVHAVSPRSNGEGLATSIRSRGSMHVDPLNVCLYATSSEFSWGYLRLQR